VERNGRHAIGRGEPLLDPVPVVDVDVHHVTLPLEKFNDAQDAARDRAETRDLALFAK
jgi:hypothetical protein